MRTSQAFSDRIDALLLKAPIFGEIVRDSVIARYSRTLSTTFAAGVPLVEALDATAAASGNAVYSKSYQTNARRCHLGLIPLSGH